MNLARRLAELSVADALFIFAQLESHERRPVTASPLWNAEPSVSLDVLSTRQRQIFDLLANGVSYAEVSQRLGVSGNTIKTHMKTVLRKLGCRSSRDFVRILAGQPVLGARGAPKALPSPAPTPQVDRPERPSSGETAAEAKTSRPVAKRKAAGRRRAPASPEQPAVASGQRTNAENLAPK